MTKYQLKLKDTILDVLKNVSISSNAEVNKKLNLFKDMMSEADTGMEYKYLREVVIDIIEEKLKDSLLLSRIQDEYIGDLETAVDIEVEKVYQGIIDKLLDELSNFKYIFIIRGEK